MAVPIVKYPDIVDYLKAESNAMSANSFSQCATLAQWQAQRSDMQRKLKYMLGLDPMPARTPLNAQITGTIDNAAYPFIVEKLVFESKPKVYITGNLFVPRNLTAQVPTILYVCGHTPRAGGSKIKYQHHGIWFARHGYVCLVMDNLYSNEFGVDLHHGVYNYGKFDLYSRGFTPAGPETWNAIRALDYLCTRPEVDTTKLGVAGISGGGRMSWFLPAVDDRVACAAPTCGTCSQHQLINEQTINEDCDCDYFPDIFKLSMQEAFGCIAPRPVMYQNGTQDMYYPKTGYEEFTAGYTRIYSLCGASQNLAPKEYAVPHCETPEMLADQYEWFNWNFKNDNSQLTPVMPESLFTSSQLVCFPAGFPADQRNAFLETEFNPVTVAPILSSASDLAAYKKSVVNNLKQYCFYHFTDAGFSSRALQVIQTEAASDQGTYTREGLTYQCEANYRGFARLRIPKVGTAPYPVYIYAIDELATVNMQMEATLSQFIASGIAVLEVKQRGAISDTLRSAGSQTEEWYTLRSANCIGRSPVAMGAVDLLRAVEVLKADERINASEIRICGSGKGAVISLYVAALNEMDIKGVYLSNVPYSHIYAEEKTRAPVLMSVLKYCDIPQVAGLLAPRTCVIASSDTTKFAWTRTAFAATGTPNQLIMSKSVVEVPSMPHNEKTRDTIVFAHPSFARNKITYTLAAEGDIRISIMNASGKTLRTLNAGRQKPGTHDIIWDGKDNHGISLAKGSYICRIHGGKSHWAKRMLSLD